MSKKHLTIYYDNDKTFTARDIGYFKVKDGFIYYNQEFTREDNIREMRGYGIPLGDVIGYKLKKKNSMKIVRLKACTMVGGLIK